MSKRQTEAEFQASLAAKLQMMNQSSAASDSPTNLMILTTPPTGPSKTLEQLISDNKEPQSNPLNYEAFVKTPDAVVSVNQIANLPVNLIDDSPWQPRGKYDESHIQALGAMLEDRGQDEPITVRKLDSGRYQLTSGHCRVRAARLIGWSEIKALIVMLDDRAAHIATLVSNEGHKGLSDYERAKSYQEAIKEGFAKTQHDIARLFGTTQARVSQCLSMFKMPVDILNILDKYPDLITYRYATVVADLVKKYPNGIDKIALGIERLIDDEELNTDDLVSFVEKSLNVRKRSSPIKPTIVPNLSGISLFEVKVTPRQIIINIKEDIDINNVGKITIAALRQLAQNKENNEK